MKITEAQVNRLIAKAQKAWGLTDWTIEWQFGNCGWEGDVVIRFTEKYALITLDRNKITDRQNLARTVYHELGHCLIEVIDRNLSDFVDHYIHNKKTRDIFWERLNTDENTIIDHIVIQMLGI